MPTENLALLITRFVPGFANLPISEVTACVRHHVGACREIDIEDALNYLAE